MNSYKWKKIEALMPLYKVYGLMLFFCFSFLNSYGQQRILKNINTDDGLPGKKVYYITQDNEGYIWIATSNGICKYNGLTFENFNSFLQLPKEEIIQIHGSKNGKVWLYSVSGAVYYWKDNTFYSSESDSSIAKLQLKSMSRIYYENNKEEWLGNWQYGAVAINSKNKDTLSCFAILPYQNNKTLIVNRNVLKTTDNNYLWKKGFNFSMSDRIITIQNQMLSVSDEGKVFCYDLKKKLVIPINTDTSFNFSSVYHLISDNNNIYCATSNGLFKFKIINNKQVITEHFLPKTIVSNVFLDKNKNLWIATLSNGIYFISSTTNPFYKYKANNEIISFTVGKRILAGEKDKIFDLTNNGRKLVYDFENASIEVRSILDLENNIIVGHNAGLCIIDKKTNIKINYFYETSLGEIGTLGSIKNLSSKKDTLYVASHRGCFFISDYLKQFKANKIIGGRVNDVLKTDNDLWLAKENGLYKVKNNSEQLIEKGSFRCLDQCDGKIYAGTFGKGIVVIKNNITTHIKSSLISENYSCSDLFSNSKHILYAATNKGVLVINSDSVVHLIDKNSGLIDYDLNKLKVVNDTLLFSSKNGLFFMPSLNLKNKSFNPLLYIKEIRVNNIKYKVDELTNLNYTKNNITISFVPIHFSSEQLFFEYNIGGKWTSFESPQIVLGDLSPKKYRLLIRARSRFSSWSKALTLTIKINPPYWQTNWFKLIIFTVLLICFYLFFKIRVLTYNKDVVRDFLQYIFDKLKPQKTIVVKRVTDGSTVKLDINEILFVKASRNYCEIVLKESKVLVRGNIKEMEERFAKEKQLRMIRIHRSFMVNKDNIKGFNPNNVIIGEHEIASGKSIQFKNEFELLKRQFFNKKL